MKTLWYIAKKDLLQVLTERNSFILLLIVPIMLIAIIGAAFGNDIGGTSKPADFTVAVSNKDDGYMSDTLLKALQAKSDSYKITLAKLKTSDQVIQQVNDGKAIAGLVIPANMTKNVSDAASKGKQVSNIVQFYTPPNSNDQRVTIVQQIVTNVMNKQVDTVYTGGAAVQQAAGAVKQTVKIVQATANAKCTSGAWGNLDCQSGANVIKPPTNTIDAQAITKAVGNASPTNTDTPIVQLLNTGSAPSVNSFDRSLPGFAILFALFSLNTAAGTILQEKEDGTFRRLLIAPVPRYALLGGKLLAQFVLTLLQLSILFTIGHLVFKLNIVSWQAISLLVIGTSFAITGVGILLVSIVRTRRQLVPVVTLTTLITSAVGGAWWPLWTEPVWMQQIAKIGITAWALEGFYGVMLFGKSLADVSFNILGLFGYGLICFLIAVRLFRFQEKGA